MAITTTTDLLQRHLSDWQIQLQIWATSGALVDAAKEALLLETVPASLKDLNSRLAVGDWSDIPKIQLLSGSGMGGAIGAWADSTQTIYLNSDWVSGASKEQIFAVLTEEFGHYLDSQFNETDTWGDEGELFSRILEGDGLSSDEIAAIGSESDAVILTLADGSQIQAEAATITGGEGNDTLTGTNSADTINGRGGNDTIFGNGGNDYIYGGTGSELIYGGDGDDYIENENKYIYLSGSDIVYAENGNDTVRTSWEPNGASIVDLGDGYDLVMVYVTSEENGIKAPLDAYPATLDGQEFIGGSGVDTFWLSLGYNLPLVASLMQRVLKSGR